MRRNILRSEEAINASELWMKKDSRHFDWTTVGIFATLENIIHSVNGVGLDRIVSSEDKKHRCLWLGEVNEEMIALNKGTPYGL